MSSQNGGGGEGKQNCSGESYGVAISFAQLEIFQLFFRKLGGGNETNPQGLASKWKGGGVVRWLHLTEATGAMGTQKRL